MLQINILTLFPSFFKSPLKVGVLSRSIEAGRLKINLINPRDFTKDLHQSVDDSPFGGGDGMVMKYEPLEKALESLGSSKKIIYLSPQGQKWNYKKAREYAEQKTECSFLCGRYAGVDQRFISEYVEEEISIGDYVLTGGEPAMLTILDSLSRFIEGTLGNPYSAKEESFEREGLLEPPQWTRPKEIKDYKIPEVIFSGHHKNIEEFRELLSVLITYIKRPDLLSSEYLTSTKSLSKAIRMVKNLSKDELQACGLTKDCLQVLKIKN